MLADLAVFAGDLLDNWAAFMTGGIPVALLAIWERWRSRNVSFRFYAVVFLAVGFAAASFQTWRQERTAKIQAEEFSSHSRSTTTTQHLQKYYAEASQFQREALAVANRPEDEFRALEARTDAWSKDAGGWILQNMGEAAYHRVIQTEGLRALNAETNDRVRLQLIMGAIRDNLANLLENSAWDKP
jgi:hypothetical protein